MRVFIFAVFASIFQVSPMAAQNLPAPFPEVGKTYYVRYAPGADNTLNTIKVLRVESNGWLLVEVPVNKPMWINPEYIMMANLIENR